jgi:drug/metabolite transporter (DMT)-like permease
MRRFTLRSNPWRSPSDRQRALGYLFLTALLWSCSGLFVKVLSWGPLAILSARSMAAAVVLLLWLRPRTLRWTWLQLVGALGYMGVQLFFIAGTKLAPVANIIFLAYTAPLYLVLFGYWFLDERPQRADWLTMPLIFAGMLLFFGDDLSFEGFRGNLFGALSGMAMAVLIVAMRRQKAGTPGHTILLGNFLGILLGLPWLWQETFTPSSVSIILFLGVFQLGLSFVLYASAIKQLAALESTLILMLEPIFNPLWVFLALGEVPGPLALWGGALVVAAVLLRAWLSSRTAVPAPASP